MSVISHDGRRSAPRSAERPYGFTISEFTQGAFYAWLWAQPVLIAVALVNVAVLEGLGGGFPSYLAAFGFPVVALIGTVPSTLAGMPIAYLIGLALRREGRLAVHVIAFTAYGALLGVASVLAFFAEAAPFRDPMTVGLAAASAIAVPLGWRSEQKEMRRNDRTAAERLARLQSHKEDDQWFE